VGDLVFNDRLMMSKLVGQRSPPAQQQQQQILLLRVTLVMLMTSTTTTTTAKTTIIDAEPQQQQPASPLIPAPKAKVASPTSLSDIHKMINIKKNATHTERACTHFCLRTVQNQ